MLLFVRVWIEHHPPIPEEIAESAAAGAEARFERYLDLVMQGLSGNSAVNWRRNGSHAPGEDAAYTDELIQT